MAQTTSRLIKNLLPEACQTEQSAKTHCASEANRLGGAPPAAPMRDTSVHAARMLRELETLARARGVNAGRGAGRAIGRLFSAMRKISSDLVGSAEKSYRATILGMQHGRGLFLLLEDAAIASGDQELADFCGRWLTERDPIVARAEQELSWFADHPEVALTRAVLLGRMPTPRLVPAT